MNYSYHLASGSELNPLSSFPDPLQTGDRGVSAQGNRPLSAFLTGDLGSKTWR